MDLCTLHRLENLPMSKQQLVNLDWNSGNVNVYADVLWKAVYMAARSPEKFMEVTM